MHAEDWTEYAAWLDATETAHAGPDVMVLLAKLRWTLIDEGRNPGLLTLASLMGDDGYEE
jgi:hypothetical protein